MFYNASEERWHLNNVVYFVLALLNQMMFCASGPLISHILDARTNNLPTYMPIELDIQIASEEQSSSIHL